MQRKIRVLVGKPGLDGHDRGAKVVAAALRDAGMEVIYTGLHQSSDQIVEAAAQEDVDVVALSILSGAHMTLFPEVLERMRGLGIGDKLLTGGGIIPAEDMDTLAGMGVGKLFGPGSSTQDIVEYIRVWFAERHGADALTPLPPPRPLEPVFVAPAPVTAPRASRPSPKSESARGSSNGRPRASARPKATSAATARPARSSRARVASSAARRAAPARKPSAGARRAATSRATSRSAKPKTKRAATRTTTRVASTKRAVAVRRRSATPARTRVARRRVTRRGARAGRSR